MTFDFCIQGAGLAGISVADKLSRNNFTVAVVDPGGVGGGASGVPAAMVNPASGRHASVSWRGIEGYNAVLETLQRIQEGSKIPFFAKTGVIRPAPDEETARKMKGAFEKTDWPAGWCRWLGEHEMRSEFPELKVTGGGLWIPEALTVKVPVFLNAYAENLTRSGVRFYTGTDYNLKRNGRNWEIIFGNSDRISADNVITAAGIDSKNTAPWNYLPLHPVKGQAALIELSAPFPYSCAVYNSGYAFKYNERTIAAGSTYEHDFTSSEPVKANYHKILDNLELILPDVREKIKGAGHWAGIRVSTPNRLPVLGRHPEYHNLYIFTGLGSKGLLFSSYLAQLLCEFIADGRPLPRGVDAARLDNYLPA